MLNDAKQALIVAIANNLTQSEIDVLKSIMYIHDFGDNSDWGKLSDDEAEKYGQVIAIAREVTDTDRYMSRTYCKCHVGALMENGSGDSAALAALFTEGHNDPVLAMAMERHEAACDLLDLLREVTRAIKVAREKKTDSKSEKRSAAA